MLKHFYYYKVSKLRHVIDKIHVNENFKVEYFLSVVFFVCVCVRQTYSYAVHSTQQKNIILP